MIRNPRGSQAPSPNGLRRETWLSGDAYVTFQTQLIEKATLNGHTVGSLSLDVRDDGPDGGQDTSAGIKASCNSRAVANR